MLIIVYIMDNFRKDSNFSSSTLRYTQLCMACVTIVAGLCLLFMGFYSPPSGEISNSVLIAFGEVATFAGALLGIDYHYQYKK